MRLKRRGGLGNEAQVRLAPVALLDPSLIMTDASGAHRRYSFQTALVADDMRCSIHWALQAATVKPPHSAQRTVQVSTAPALDDAREAALVKWLLEDTTDHILLWPAGQHLAWNAIKILCEERDEAAQVASAHWLSREVVRRTARPFFADGRWTGEGLAARPGLASPRSSPPPA